MMLRGSERGRAVLFQVLHCLLLVVSATAATAFPRAEVASERRKGLEDASDLVTHSAEQLDKMIVETEQSSRVVPVAGAVAAASAAAVAAWIFRRKRRRWEPQTPEGSPASAAYEAREGGQEKTESAPSTARPAAPLPTSSLLQASSDEGGVVILTPRPSAREDEQPQQPQPPQRQSSIRRLRALLSQLQPLRPRWRPATTRSCV